MGALLLSYAGSQPTHSVTAGFSSQTMPSAGAGLPHAAGKPLTTR